MDRQDALLVGLVILLGVQTLRLAWRSIAPGLSLHFKKRRASRAERDAETLLEELGYRVDETQVSTKWPVECDGLVHHANLRADLLVSRDGRRFVAEVKSGMSAPHIETRATRRQLLEYRLAYDTDGVLLVDMTARRVREIRFPGIGARRRGHGGWWLLGATAACVVAVWTAAH